MEIFTVISLLSFAPSLTKETSAKMEKTILTFNDLPEVVAQLRDEVMSLRSLLTEQHCVNLSLIHI